jgi:Ca2+-binding RTX toxin-like protein
LNIRLNGRLYRFASHDNDGKPLTLYLKTHGGNDHVHIDANVMQPIVIETGDGNDRIQAGGGDTRVVGGNGNDVVRLGSGLGYAEGNDGDDLLMGGSGDSVLYGNNGNDRLYAGAAEISDRKNSPPDPIWMAATAMTGCTPAPATRCCMAAAGHDRLIGHDRSTFYTGDGYDTVIANRPGDRIYAQPGDSINPLNGSLLTAVSAHAGPIKGFAIKGSAAFIQRVEDDLALLRHSPQGQQMLAEMDAAADRNAPR